VRSIKTDDWWILAAWFIGVAFSTSICVGVRYGLGTHRDEISDESFAALKKAEYAFAILYNPALMLTKTSILAFYLAVMSKDVDKVFKWCNWLTLAVVNIGGAAFTFLAIFQCRPIPAAYRYPVAEGARCTDIVTLYLSSAPVNIITDIAILLLPMPILTAMRLPKKQKIILVATFSAGAFVAVVDVVRLAYLQNAASDRIHEAVTNSASSTTAGTQGGNDFSWDASLSFMWSAVEVHLGILCACVPGLKPLFLRFLPQLVKDAGDPDTQLDTRDRVDVGQPKATATPMKGGDISMLNNPAAFRKPAVKEYAGSDDGDNMGFLNMLSGPDDDAPEMNKAGTRKSTSAMSRTLTRKSTAPSASDFGFVKMAGTKNMLRLTNRQSCWPIAVVTVIFFLWGFAYGLLDQLNAQFQRVVQISTAQGLGLHAAYFSGYLVGPLTLGRFILKRYGFKAAMMTGLCVYGAGTLVFWPSAVLTSYVAFVISNFIVGFGLSCLEIAANPYIALCGPLEYAEVRLNLSQAFQAIGTVVSPLLARKALFDQTQAGASLVDTQWAYLGIALFVFALAIAFYYIPLPEASDEELAEQADRREAVYATKVGPYKVIYVTLAFGVFNQWCYVGLQEAVGNQLQPLYSRVLPNASLAPPDFQTVAHTVFAVGRFLAAFLNYLFKPRWILLGLWLGMVITNALQMRLDGTGAAAVAQLTELFEAGAFSIIFAMCMRGLGAHTKTGSAFMTAAISGGAVFPPIQWAASNAGGVRYSYCVPLAVACFGVLFPIYLNVVPAARKQVDPIHEKRAARRERRKEIVERSDSTFSTATQSNEFGLKGILARHRKEKLYKEKDRATEEVDHGSTTHDVDMAGGKPPLSPLSTSGPAWNHEEFVQMSSPKGLVGDLKPFSGYGTESYYEMNHQESRESSTAASGSGSSKSKDFASRSQQGEREPTRHRPNFNDVDDDNSEIIDYHAFMRA
jgi:fucose permease